MKTLLCGLCLLLAGCVTVPTDPIGRTNNALTASVGDERIHYTENAGDGEYGAMPAGELAYSLDSDGLIFAASAKYAHSTDVEYNGFTLQANTPLIYTHPSTTEDAVVQLGGLIPGGDHFQTGALAHVDYHLWNRNGTVNAAGYDEKYQHADLGIDFLFQWYAGPVVFSFTPTVLFMANPKMVASDLPGAPGVRLTFHLTPTFGGGADFRTSLIVTQHQSLSIDLSGTYFHYVESGDVEGLMEPNSYSFIPTLMVGYSLLL